MDKFPCFSYWHQVFKEAFKRAWEHFGIWLAIGSIASIFLLIAFVADAFRKMGVDMNWWLLIIPAIAAFYAFTMTLIVAPYQMHKQDQKALNDKNEELLKEKAAKLSLEADLKTVQGRNDELIHAKVVGEQVINPNEWPPLTDTQIEQWINALRPFSPKSLKISTRQSVEITSFFRSLQKVGKGLNIEADLFTGFPTHPGEFRIQAVANDPAALKLVQLCENYTTPVTTTYLNMSSTHFGELDIYVGVRPEVISPAAPLKLRVDFNREKLVSAARWQTGPAIFYRVDVQSLCAEPIVDCRACLTKIERNGVEKWGGEKVPLTFVPGESADSLCRTINPRAKEILDILIEHKGALYPANWPRTSWFDHTKPLHTIFEGSGNYIFTIVIEAKNILADEFYYKFTRTNGVIGGLALDRATPPANS